MIGRYFSDFWNDLKNHKLLGVVFLGSLLIFLVLLVKTVQLVNNTGTTVDTNQSLDYDFSTGISLADYNLEKTAFTPSLPTYSIKTSELTNLNNFEKVLGGGFSAEQKKALENNNFFVVKNTDKFWQDSEDDYTSRNDDWTYLYDRIGGDNNPCYREPEDAVFITSDFLLHVYHRLLDKEFEYIEDTKLYPMLKDLTDSTFETTLNNYQNQDESSNKESYQRLIAFLAIPKVILDSAEGELGNSMADQNLDTDKNILANLENLKGTIPDESYGMALKELKLILKHEGSMASPIFGKYLNQGEKQIKQDYTQFTVRSHYTKNSVLRSYFRAMMWYGRNIFALYSPELTRDAINLSLITKDAGKFDNWEKIYVVTSFLVGKSDDLGIMEYQEVLDGLNYSKVDDNLVTEVQEGLKNYNGPRIQSSVIFGKGVFSTTKEELLAETKGFRFMGQRFTPDAFIFSSLTQGDEEKDQETGQSLPSSTTALLVASIMGNKTADTLADEWIAKNATDSDKVLAKNISSLKSQFENLTQKSWTQNIYWSWLYTLKSLNQEDIDKNGYPNFMKNDEWNKKNLESFLGSWTELKHDTLLYAKQSYAEMGGGGGECEENPVVKGYVEPNIEFLDRLLALIKLTSEGLANTGLVDSSVTWRDTKLEEAVEFYREIAVKELQNEIISDDDFEKLRNSAGYLSMILSNITNDEMREKDARSAIVADVHTDAVKSEILYEADGIPNYIFVAVKDNNGTRLTRGLVYDYYEFTQPLETRLTDSDWQKINYTTNKSGLPEQSDWVESLYK